MTEKDFNKIILNECCPFLISLDIKEHKKLVKLANVSEEKSYELHEIGSSGEISFSPNIKLENLVLAEERSYEGSFIKLFRTEFLLSLGEYSMKIFVHITNILEINNNKVTMTISDLMLKCKIKEPRKVYDGLAELIKLKVIAKHRGTDTYYVNPNIVFRGKNRRVLFTHKDY